MATRPKVEITALDDLFGGAAVQASSGDTIQVRIDDLYEFPSHPYRVEMNPEMEALIQSIAANGVLSPLSIWDRPEGGYYIIAGHRRRFASKKAGLAFVPAIKGKYTEEEAIIAMVDSNLYREEILPSEKAWAYRMKLEALNRQGQRSDNTSRPVVAKLSTADEVGKQQGDSGRQVQRYARLTYLLTGLLELVDKKKLKFRPAVELSYLPQAQQMELEEVIEEEKAIPSMEQALRLKDLSADGRLNKDVCSTVLTEKKAKQNAKVQLRQKILQKYIPEEYTAAETEQLLETLLKEWAASRPVVEKKDVRG